MKTCKKVMILGASNLQVPLITKAKKMGFWVIVVSPDKSEPGFAFADEAVYINVLDEERVLEEARKRKIDGIVTDMAEAPVRTVAYVAQKLGLPGIDPEIAHLFTNKYLMRNLCKEHNLPHPKYTQCSKMEEALAFFAKVNGTVVIKPLDSSASRGVFFVNTQEELQTCFAEAMSYSKVEHKVILEEYISGPQFSVDSIKTATGVQVLAISRQRQFDHDESVAKELRFMYENPEFDYEELRKVNTEIIKYSGLHVGLTHGEYRYHDGKFYLIEITCRGGGVFIASHVVPYVSGIDNYEYLLKYCVGENVNTDIVLNKAYRSRTAIVKFFELPEGVVEAVKGEDYLANCPDIPIYEIHIAEGDVVKGARNGTERAGFYVACCETAELLEQTMENVERDFQIVVKESEVTV